MSIETTPTSTPVERRVRRRSKLVVAFKEEIKHWKHLSFEQDCLLRIFCACVDMRMRGEDPATLLPQEEAAAT